MITFIIIIFIISCSGTEVKINGTPWCSKYILCKIRTETVKHRISENELVKKEYKKKVDSALKQVIY